MPVQHTLSPWLAMRPDLPPHRLASLLRSAHASVMDGGEPPLVVREVVARSWRRSVAAGVDPEASAPRIFDEDRTRQRLSRHKFGPVIGRLEARLFQVTHDGGHLAAFSDADGVLLWADGAVGMLDAAVRPRFLPGYSCREDLVGTNAVGTALALDHAVQIFSAEHFARRLHGWTCAAAPIHDPATGDMLGVLNLSSRARLGNSDTVGLVDALARAVELELSVSAANADERLLTRFLRVGEHRAGAVLVNADARVLFADPPTWVGLRLQRPLPDQVAGKLPDGGSARWDRFGGGFALYRVNGRQAPERPVLSITAVGTHDVVVEVSGRQVRLSRRHSAIILALARHPEGLKAQELAQLVYGGACSPVTLRAELARLRRLLGPVFASGPYRLNAEVSLP